MTSATVTFVDAAGALPHTRALSMDGASLSLRLAAPPTTLPATATVTLSTGITDLAGNPMVSAESVSFTYPVWVAFADLSVAPNDLNVHHVAVAPDDSIWVAYYEVTTAAPPVRSALSVARYDGTTWSDVGGGMIAERDSIGPAHVSFLPSGDAFVAVSTSDAGVYAIETWQWNGSAWSAGPSLARDATLYDIEMEVEPAGSVVLASREGPGVLVRRLVGGAWVDVAPLIAWTGYGYWVDLIADGVTVVVAYYRNYDCDVQVEVGGAWSSLGTAHSGSSIYSECGRTSLVRRGGSLYAFVAYKDQTGSASSVSRGKVLRYGTAWTELSGFPFTVGYRAALASSTGFYAASPHSGSLYVVDESTDRLPGALPLPFTALVLQSGEPVVVSGAPAMFHRANSL